MAKREKKYSFDEALAYAKQEMASQWLFSEPLFYSSIDEKGEYYIQPLCEKITNGLWCIFFMTLHHDDFENDLHLYEVYRNRYLNHGIQFLLVITEESDLLSWDLKMKTKFTDWVSEKKIECPIVFDENDKMKIEFGEKIKNRILIIIDGEEVYNKSDEKAIEGSEEMIQQYIRKDQPGFSGMIPFKG